MEDTLQLWKFPTGLCHIEDVFSETGALLSMTVSQGLYCFQYNILFPILYLALAMAVEATKLVIY